MKNLFYKIILTFCILPGAYCQVKADSLLLLVKTAKNDIIKAKLLTTLAWNLKENNVDTAIILCNQAIALSGKTSDLSDTSKLRVAKMSSARAYKYLGICYTIKSDLTLSLEAYFKAFKLEEELKNKKGMADCFANIGIVYIYRADFSKALDYCLKALRISENLKDVQSCILIQSNIGSIYLNMYDYSKALEAYLKVLKLQEEIGQGPGTVELENLGIIYENKSDFAKAFEYYFKALEIYRESGNKLGMASCLNNIGFAYMKQSIYPKALHYNLMALKENEELGNKNGIATSLGCIGEVHLFMTNYKEAFACLYRSVSIANSIDSKSISKESYHLMSTVFEKSDIALPDTPGGKLLNKEEMRLQSLYYFKKYIALRDTIFSEENKKQLIQKEMNYDFEKKEAVTKAEQEKKDAIAKEELKQKELQRNYFIIGFGLVGLLAIFIFRSYRQKQKANILITEQKRLVDEHQKEILDSIRYAKRIQSALLPSEKYVRKNLNRLMK